ncbi:uncharacterized protein TNCT_363891 [Trichonephila clavata]|uniref:Pre-C2HC domain-containing protein n=1 Tax=Trichonephila clavata TaxID=2740835 RepID=A0A8X6FV59_TRICU|nr:uncharacterized protein TNCT_363891 [Trichonephila clavata]
MAETYIHPSKFIPNTEEYPALPGTSQEANIQKPKPKNKAPISNDGFFTPAKFAKKPKIDDGSITCTATQNKFLLLLELNQPISTKHPSQWPTRSPSPIWLRYQTNFNLLLQDLQRTYPTSTNKLTGEYIKISAENMDDHRKMTDYLKSIKEQFFVLDPPPPSSRAQKIVIKGLPVSTDIADIKTDLESQGYTIEKVAQLTKTKTKFPLPIFMVETKKFPNSPDILKELTKCCYMKIKPKKGEASQNRNNSSTTKNVFNNSNLVRNNASYANVTKTSQQREPLDGSKWAISENEAPKTHTEKPAPSVPRNNSNNNDENFTFMWMP